jgi:hypothetical protein
MDDRHTEILLDAMGDTIQDNTSMITALLKLLIDKDIIKLEDYQKFKEIEDNELKIMIEEALDNLMEEKKESKSKFGLMGKGGDA